MNTGDQAKALELILSGGPIMWPIFALSVVGFAIFCERLLFLGRLSSDVEQLKESIVSLLRQNKIKDAVRVCESASSPAANVLKAGLLRFGAGKEAVAAAMEECARLQIPALERRVCLLSTIANVAPAMGVLGTCLGLIGVFYSIESGFTAMNPLPVGSVAGEIWRSLLCSVAGFVVAVPSLAAYTFLRNVTADHVLKMEKAAAELIERMSFLAPPLAGTGEPNPDDR